MPAQASTGPSTSAGGWAPRTAGRMATRTAQRRPPRPAAEQEHLAQDRRAEGGSAEAEVDEVRQVRAEGQEQDDGRRRRILESGRVGRA